LSHSAHYRSFRTGVFARAVVNIDTFIYSLDAMLSSYIHGDGKVSRNFLYVSDVVDAFDVILHRGSAGSTYNIGTTFEISVIDLAKYLIQKVMLPLYRPSFTGIHCSDFS